RLTAYPRRVPSSAPSTHPRTSDGPSRALHLLPAAGVSLSAFLLFALQVGWPGHAVLVVSLVAAYLLDRALAKDLLLVGVGIAIVSSTSVKADINWDRFFIVGFVLAMAVIVPVAIDRLVYRRRAIRFPWFTGRRWNRFQWSYIVAVPL